jgi:osmotically-inducible protein OsmY
MRAAPLISACLPTTVCLCCALLVTAAPAVRSEGADAAPSRDTELTLYVRAALHKDPQLGPLNLWVRVRDNVATLSGDVPSEALQRRAVEIAGRVPGIAEVKDQLRVVPTDGIPDGPSAFPEGPPKEPAPGELTGHQKDRDGGKPLPQKTQFGDPEPAAGSLGGAVSLGTPVPLGPKAEGDRGHAPAELLRPRPLPAARDLAADVEALRRQDERFRRVQIAVREGQVYLGGTVARWEDVNDLAAAVRRLPGVRAVILDNVQVGR